MIRIIIQTERDSEGVEDSNPSFRLSKGNNGLDDDLSSVGGTGEFSVDEFCCLLRYCVPISQIVMVVINETQVVKFYFYQYRVNWFLDPNQQFSFVVVAVSIDPKHAK